MLQVLDPPAVRRWSWLAAETLGRAREEIDALNVFPVPDGDTGTNLHLTMLSAAEALDGLPGDADAATTWRTLAQGALLGARGNSGVIVSQALRGLAEVLRTAEGGGADLGRGLARAAELARGAVERPVEGTLLSVLGAAASAVRDLSGDLASVAARAAQEARAALRRTPDQLEVLSRNGVVDAGAAGLTLILESLAAVVTGSYAERPDVPAPVRRVVPGPEEPHRPEGHPGYEVMYLLDAGDEAVETLRGELDALGDSLVVVGGDGLWNVHVHVEDAGAAIEAALRAGGRPHRIRVTYLAGSGRTHPAAGGRGVVAVAAGPALGEVFERSGAVVVRREPGSSPSLAAVLAAIRGAGTEVVVLPNDSGAREVAAAAAEIAREEGLAVSVLPTRASVQGLAALAVHDPLRRFDDDVVAMTEAAAHTRHGHVWVADREVMTSAGLIRPGAVLGVIDGDAALVGADLVETALEVVGRMVSSSSELVTLLEGADAPAGLAQAVQDRLAETRPDIEVVRYGGGQGGYPLLVGVE
ncbi:dihydroxyacetone kinase [Planomonospora parontospora subsp. parontospora]|uniref:Dihydroxyacetone kinase n=2 Tax=Planomonospora parontospora TaxID=58119 RepID=A0AA37BCU6_9ACTN|nr:DAK2 domain-containing protein [Planomonospora parontospora]GGK51236.1 dihydroxyacetone kinase [Planomonospora parontospora]GII07022.1 dihydroxyacetone kinase [Planomonospora parontospora subsp. parontospora]